MESRRLLRDFLLAQSQVYRELSEVRVRVWAKEDVDEYFKQQRERADNASAKGCRKFFNIMQHIGHEMEASTGQFALCGTSPLVLDLCMAPGGFSAALLKHCPGARVCGITLPLRDGGHKLLLRHGVKDPRVEALELDITMLSSEFGVDDIPEDHADANNFLRGECPHRNKSFDLVFCDGQVLRKQARASYRERNEASRLICSQLILALQRIYVGGTIIILLHKLDSWKTFKLLSQFNNFAIIKLFKPGRSHSLKNSFYLIATAVDPSHPVARDALMGWKRDWKQATFAYDKEQGKEIVQDLSAGTEESDLPIDREEGEEASRLLTDFGPKLIRLAEPVWTIQRDALSCAKFIAPSSAETKSMSSPVKSEAVKEN